MGLHEDLLHFMEKSGKSQSQIAREIGFSAAVLSQYLKGIYKGDVGKVENQIKNYLTLAKERLNKISTRVYNPDTENTKKILMAVTYAHQYSKMAMIYGDAGAGKTEALKHYVEDNPGVIMVTANASCKTARAILFQIANALDLHPTGTEANIMELLIERLSGTHRLIIIDEADHLTLNALQAIRNLYDVAGVGVVLSGNEMVIYQMYVKRNSQSTKFDQLRSRVGMKIKVSNRSFTYSELCKIFPYSSEGCINELLDITKGYSLRTAINVCEYAGLIASSSSQELSGKIIRMAFESAFKLI